MDNGAAAEASNPPIGLPETAGKSAPLATQSRQKSHELSASDILSAAFDNPSAALNEAAIVAVTDAHGTILSVNEKFCEISGYSAAELIGQNHRLLKSDAHDHRFFKNLYSAISRGHTWRGTICNRAKDGHLYWVDTTIVALRTDTGRILGFTSIRFDVTPLKLARQDLWARAHFDELTGAANRSHFLNLLSKRLSDADSCAFHVAMLDLDHFKEVNDSSGHAVGDELLQNVARIVLSHLQAGETLGRLGGDEFGIIFNTESGVADTEQRLDQRLRAILREIQTLDMSGCAGPRSTASCGVVRYPEDGNNAHQLMQRADLALYAAKKMGGDEWRPFHPDYEDSRTRTMDLRGRFFKAFANGQIQIYFQPIVSVERGRYPSFESLIRWISDDGAIHTPSAFIALMDDEAVLREIGRFALCTAIDQIERWTKQGLHFELIAVNATSPDLRSEAFVAQIAEAIQQGRIEPHQLCIEITEGMLLDRQAHRVRAAIDRLSGLGVKIAFDDFGTGFASLTHLRELPIHYVKLDRSFIQSLGTNEKDRVIVESIVTLAHRLGLGVVAEGVEAREQVDILHAIGCDRIQGFLVSKAIATEQALLFLQRYRTDTLPYANSAGLPDGEKP